MDMVQKIIHPLPEVHVCCLAASHQGVDDGSIFSSVVIAAEEIILASDSHGAHTVLYQVRVWEGDTFRPSYTSPTGESCSGSSRWLFLWDSSEAHFPV